MTHEAIGTGRWASKSQRIDKWLWCARFFKSRTKAAKLCDSGAIRVNRWRVGKASHGLRVGDVITLPLGKTIRVVRILELAERRGPAAQARALYVDLLEEGDGQAAVCEGAPRSGQTA